MHARACFRQQQVWHADRIAEATLGLGGAALAPGLCRCAALCAVCVWRAARGTSAVSVQPPRYLRGAPSAVHPARTRRYLRARVRHSPVMYVTRGLRYLRRLVPSPRYLRGASRDVPRPGRVRPRRPATDSASCSHRGGPAPRATPQSVPPLPQRPRRAASRHERRRRACRPPPSGWAQRRLHPARAATRACPSLPPSVWGTRSTQHAAPRRAAIKGGTTQTRAPPPSSGCPPHAHANPTNIQAACPASCLTDYSLRSPEQRSEPLCKLRVLRLNRKT